MADNPIHFGTGTAAHNAVVTGQQALEIGMPPNAYYGLKSQGAPVQWVWIDPMPGGYSTTVILKTAPHPNMAKLWIQWVASIDGQLASQNTGVIASLPLVAATNSSVIAPGISVNPVDLFSEQARWTSVFTKLFPGP